jgi:uncharacterized protein (DUF1697 family)
MPHYIAFLRGINVGGARVLKMESLRRAFEPLGFSRIETFIASGNVAFDSPIRSAASLEAMIGKRLQAALGYQVDTFVRTHAELQAIAAYKAFPASKMKTAELYVIFLGVPPNAGAKQKLKSFQTGTDEFRARGREVYWLRSKKPGAVPYSTIQLEKALAPPFTIRSMKTIKKAAENISGC